MKTASMTSSEREGQNLQVLERREGCSYACIMYYMLLYSRVGLEFKSDTAKPKHT